VAQNETVDWCDTGHMDVFLGPADEKCSDVLFTLKDIMKYPFHALNGLREK